ncbi:RNA polymerase sigma factor [Armatimonas sp.]|uniref:RNA polymerase sigma factor n=1 Tax=Armatimonas sp. TaxID=1872638 RepID=UPI003750CDCC
MPTNSLKAMLTPDLKLLLEHKDRIYRLALRLSAGCVSEAEDITQETLLAALKTLPLFLGRARLTTWLHTITIRTWRARQKRLPLKTESLDESEGIAPEDIALRLDLDRAIRTLSGSQREAFVLVKAEGWTHKEAAKILGVPQGTVQARVFEATRRLRELLSEEEIK